MPAAPLPPNEDERLAALAAYEIFETPPDEPIDNLARLAATICDTPLGLVTLVGARRQWLKARVGLDVYETPRDLAFCAYALLSEELLIVEDASADPRFSDNELVLGEMHLRFYVGAPLLTPEKHVLGTLCVLDREPRSIGEDQKTALRTLARAVVDQFELRRRLRELEESRIEVGAARDRAFEASRRKTRFLARMSHEMRTPMTSILGFADLLLRGASGALNPDQRKSISYIADAGSRLVSMVNDLLDLSKIEAGKAEIEFESFAIEGLVEQVLGTLSPLARKKGLGLEHRRASRLPLVQADPGRVRQILLNLLSNAIKFTERGGVEVRIRRIEDVNHEGGFVEVAVEDTGIGIAGEGLEEIFDEFAQLGGRRLGMQGTGLGLALCRELVQLMKGEIRVESELGRGSVFTFTLPVCPSSAAAGPPP